MTVTCLGEGFVECGDATSLLYTGVHISNTMGWVLHYLVLTFVHLALGSISYDTSPSVHATCCYGDAHYDHGDVILTLPKICLQLVCNNGKVERHYFDKPGDENCCEFDGQLYPEGEELTAQCVPMVCYNSCWTPVGTIDDCCNHCCLHDDPHIYTFDGYQYDWHGICNYSVAQSDLTYYPDVAVYSDFVACYGRASCLAHTTFKNDPHTVITLFNGAVFDLIVNGESFHVKPGKVQTVKSSAGCHPVLVWRTLVDHPDGYCTMLLGSSRLVLQHCPHRLDIWAHPSHTGDLDGLCGHFNFYVDDDFTNRNGEVHNLNYWPLAFPSSWRTDTQSDYSCKAPCYDCHHETTTNPCNVTSYEWERYKTMCQDSLGPIIGDNEQLNTHINTCAFDVCMILGYGEDQKAVQFWLLELQKNLRVSTDIIKKTKKFKKTEHNQYRSP
ncbi:von Willebrand factor-like isoform X2 [Panulirus ornatus]|uniref:von Willebrand factor-like isoform X2 n=1 Tax=Panulirus ornatus TaxID=150431 RepID=UPI003A882323